MKKLLFSAFALIGATIGSQAQVIFNIVEPSNISGTIPFTSNGDGSSWGLANLDNPSDAILDTIVIADDGTPGLNPQGNPIAYEACDSIINNVAGKIAMIYRNTCGFGVKALNAQNAGAIGVIIVNREPGLVNMNGGAEGANVTIPVTFISSVEGQLIRTELDAGNVVTAFIGNKLGYFQNDVGLSEGEALMPRAAAEFKAFSADASEYSTPLAFFARNFGSANQTGITATAEVSKDGNVLYTNTSTAFDLLSGDSAYITFPNFELPAYDDGIYSFSYTLNLAGDEFTGDNSISTEVYRNDSVHSYVAIDPATNLPASSSGIRPASFTSSYTSCVPFVNSNASRALLTGASFAASTSSDDSLNDKILDVYVYEWNDIFTDVTDANFGFSDLLPIASEAYSYADNSLQGEFVSVNFNPEIQLVNDQRYLVCVTSYFTSVYINHSDQINYELNNVTAGNQPIQGLEVDGTWYTAGWSSPTYPAIVMHMKTSDVGVNEWADGEIQAYPNPAVDRLYIPWDINRVVEEIALIDMNGRAVKASVDFVQMDNRLVVDVSDIAAGTYTLQWNGNKYLKVIVNH